MSQTSTPFFSKDLFDDNSPLEMTISLNFDSLYNGGISETIKYKGVLSYHSSPDSTVKMSVKLSKRGHFRKMYNVCSFPPLRIEFQKMKNQNSLFEGLDKIKIVTHCMNGDSTFDQYVIQEYLLYKTYNIITDYSFNVRLAKVKYRDTSGLHPDMIRYAIFIENTADLAKRMKGAKLDIRYIYPEVIEPYHYYLMGMFQYMIFNTDWSINLLHNIELIGIYPSLKPVAVPFDFDMAGLINIPYNSPVTAYRLGKEPVRQFLLKDINKKHLKSAIGRFISKKEEILALYQGYTLLSEANKIKILSSLNAFYRSIEDPKTVRETFFR